MRSGRGATGAEVPAAVAVRPGSIGILGGTFDPFHLGHLGLARAARDQLGLERVLVVPAAAPPHKPGRVISDGAVRLALVEAGIAGEDRIEASRIELDRDGPSYTVDTLAALAERERAAGREPDLTLVLSAESFAGLPAWRDPERLLDLARIAVAPRAGHELPDPTWIAERFPGREGRIVLIDGPRIVASGSEIRRRVAAGDPLAGFVPDGVARAIAADRLYRHPEPLEDPSIVTESAPRPGTPADESSATAAAPRPDGLPHRNAAATAAAAAPLDERPPLDIARRIVELAEDKKAADIVLLDLTGLTTLADAFVICSGGSERQLDAIADGVVEGMRAEKVRPIGREGTASSHWVLIDFGAVVVHVFTPPEREYYSLEKHWSEARTVLRVQ
ncbi:MAG TPA: nicotinate (nicotinamide) nucleotide adenylyltransferase [Candidatus Limnocylindrales bacterium]|nr:nicotinate (nicotinamide) nucleotide adenylyltransferase [Candidatus Limnocylindrales bacterium]